MDSTKLNVNNSPFSNRFCHYHIPHVRKTLHINFLCTWSIRNILCVFGDHIENSCQNGHHKRLQWPPFLNCICHYHIPQVETLLNINFRWNCSTLKFWCVLAAILTIFFRILPNFELKLGIPNIMLVCKFEINWSTNKNLRALATYIGLTDRCPALAYPPLRFAGDKNMFKNICMHVILYLWYK